MIKLYEQVTNYKTTGNLKTDVFNLESVKAFSRKEHTQGEHFIILVGTEAKHQQLIKVETKLGYSYNHEGQEGSTHLINIERLILLPSINGEQPKLYVIEELEGTLTYLDELIQYSQNQKVKASELLKRVDYIYNTGELFDKELELIYGYSDRSIAQIKKF